ncbi:RDD family protein [Rhizobium herbae]|uniref:RDD family membrane protein YckC n=1 Tax=Rhizobium herbae TaxID=508661 RepID=A0ABS4EJB7_9HYPH|nr:RDD family protein [Rhizobium herbae]MBP1858045.1 putative RDD family membrane protein YckC [Rhizobium herbae]
MTSWYYKLGKKPVGPVSSEELVELAKTGAVKPDTRLWHPGISDWKKAVDIGDFNIQFAEARANTAVEFSDPTLARPWARFWARLIDVYVVTLALGYAIGLLSSLYMPSLYLRIIALPNVVFGMILLPLAGVVLAIMMSLSGTTIGKAIVGIKVQNISGFNRFLFHFTRELKVWIFGLCLGVPVASFISMIVQHRRLSLSGSASYDKDFATVGGRSSMRRGAIGIAVAMCVLSFNGYLSFMDRMAASDVFLTQDWTNPATGMTTRLAKTWAFEELEAETGNVYYFFSEKLLAEMVFGYEPMEEENVDPVAYGEALQEAISDEVTVNSEWTPITVNGFNAARATAVHKTAADTHVEITVAIAGGSAWRTLVFVRGRALSGFPGREELAASAFSTARDINVPTNMPCEEESCLSFLYVGKSRTAF